MKQYKEYIIDLDGTMYRGNQVIEDAIPFIQTIIENDFSYVFLTNNSTMTVEQVANKLTNMGIHATPQNICTTSMATATYINRQHPMRVVMSLVKKVCVTPLKKRAYN